MGNIGALQRDFVNRGGVKMSKGAWRTHSTRRFFSAAIELGREDPMALWPRTLPIENTQANTNVKAQ